mmetsp:Transcript_33552/g.65455  ORF Transcript_33552/g.65455 Transcript_33552/m.65455 type:complete len:279 (-) Transcript_33552:614-1450(-)
MLKALDRDIMETLGHQPQSAVLSIPMQPIIVDDAAAIEIHDTTIVARRAPIVVPALMNPNPAIEGPRVLAARRAWHHFPDLPQPAEVYGAHLILPNKVHEAEVGHLVQPHPDRRLEHAHGPPRRELLLGSLARAAPHKLEHLPRVRPAVLEPHVGAAIVLEPLCHDGMLAHPEVQAAAPLARPVKAVVVYDLRPVDVHKRPVVRRRAPGVYPPLDDIHHPAEHPAVPRAGQGGDEVFQAVVRVESDHLDSRLAHQCPRLGKPSHPPPVGARACHRECL